MPFSTLQIFEISGTVSMTFHKFIVVQQPLLLCVVPAMLRTEHSCTSFGCVSARVAWASVRLDYSCLNESTGLALAALID
jgi:hypothetical protein